MRVGEIVVVLLDFDAIPHDDPRLERNIVGVDLNGRIVWHIERRQGRIGPDRKPLPNPYVGFDWDKKRKKLNAYDMGGLCFDVDLDTGKISNPVFTR